MTATVAVLHKSNFRQVVPTLRALADEIEAGKYGEVGCVAVAVLGDTLEVFGMGPDSEGPSVAALFQAGNLRLIGNLEAHGTMPFEDE